MKIEVVVGDWIRSKDGFIGKVRKISYDNMEKSNYYICEKDNVMASNYLENIANHSKNIIDLVKVGDYVNGYKVIGVTLDPAPSGKCVDIDCDKPSYESYLFEEQIYSIVTKEQFASMEYKVEEE